MASSLFVRVFTRTEWQASSRRTFKPGVEFLEDRTVPSTTAGLAGNVAKGSGLLQYHGGPLLQNVEVQAVYESALPGNTQTDLQPQVDPFLQFLVSSQSGFTQELAQYSRPGLKIGPGTFRPGDANVAPVTQDFTILQHYPPAPVVLYQGPVVFDSAIQTTLLNEIKAKRVASPKPNTLYVVVTPKDTPVVVDTDGTFADSVQDFSGYHSSFIDAATGKNIYYAVIPYVDPSVFVGFPVPYVDATGAVNFLGLGLPGSALMQDVISHEVAEAITDPQIIVTPGAGVATDVGTGWNTPVNLQDQTGGTEIADLTVLGFTTVNGYFFQDLYSNRDLYANPTGRGMHSQQAELSISGFVPFLPAANDVAFGPLFQFTDKDFNPVTDNAATFFPLFIISWGDGQLSSLGDGSLSLVQVGKSNTFQLWGTHQYDPSFFAPNAAPPLITAIVQDQHFNAEVGVSYLPGWLVNESANVNVGDLGVVQLLDVSSLHTSTTAAKAKGTTLAQRLTNLDNNFFRSLGPEMADRTGPAVATNLTSDLPGLLAAFAQAQAAMAPSVSWADQHSGVTRPGPAADSPALLNMPPIRWEFSSQSGPSGGDTDTPAPLAALDDDSQSNPDDPGPDGLVR
jgi:hypothetical protein